MGRLILNTKKKNGQMKIQQMAFMIIAVFIFFALVALFFLTYQSRTLQQTAAELAKEQAISSLSVITNMPELTCGDLCLDEEKLWIMTTENYQDLWPVASIKVYKIYPSLPIIKCPAKDCNYYSLFDSGENSSREYSTYISLCKDITISGYVQNKCEIAKLVAGVK